MNCNISLFEENLVVMNWLIFFTFLEKLEKIKEGFLVFEIEVFPINFLEDTVPLKKK